MLHLPKGSLTSPLSAHMGAVIALYQGVVIVLPSSMVMTQTVHIIIMLPVKP
jgi:hypothetical protein